MCHQRQRPVVLGTTRFVRQFGTAALAKEPFCSSFTGVLSAHGSISKCWSLVSFVTALAEVLCTVAVANEWLAIAQIAAGSSLADQQPTRCVFV
ncbi:MAG: hypothetical protein CMJ70_01925 [Planctomycetaceae bacterium]|nr:hypothetical protein [Planctomycetaceae bacterium]